LKLRKMKKALFLFAFFCSFFTVENLDAQRTYIDLTNSESTNNSNEKDGWLVEFEDLFEGLAPNPVGVNRQRKVYQ
jgi:hypothetical protein